MIELTDIYQARATIRSHVHETPVLFSQTLAEKSGNRIYLKAEHLQKTGSFKIRGATNKMAQIAKDDVSFVTAASSGNHGQAVAYAAHQYGIPATIVVPEDATLSKVNAIQDYHGKVTFCGKTSAERIPRAKALAEDNNGVYIPPYDDPYINAGQGTVGLEIMEQLETVDIVVVPVGGGGLISGIATAVKAMKPDVQVIGVEPDTAHDTYLSLQKGSIQSIQATATIADGLRTIQPGYMTFPIVSKYVDDIVLVTENEIKSTLHFIMERMKQVVEPSGAVALAAMMFDKLQVKDKNVVCVSSGGNVDIAHIGKLL